MAETAIEWATHTLNPFTGCDRVSPGCANCYALDAAAGMKRKELGRIAKAAAEGKPRPVVRYQNDGGKASGPGFGFTVHWDKIRKPPSIPAGARVFVNSMSDVFHEKATLHAIGVLWQLFASRPDVVWMVLTKRADRMLEVVSRLGDPARLEARERAGLAQLWTEWPLPNVWLGVSIENRRFVSRADLLRQTPAAVRFISAEPLLGPLLPPVTGWYVVDHGYVPGPGSYRGPYFEGWREARGVRETDEVFGPALDLTGIDWLILGGESGPDHRRLDVAWMRDLRDVALAQCPDCAALGAEPPAGWAPGFEDGRTHWRACRRHTALFVKQLGGRRPGAKLEDLPADLRIREMPVAKTSSGVLHSAAQPRA